VINIPRRTINRLSISDKYVYSSVIPGGEYRSRTDDLPDEKSGRSASELSSFIF
jgi:hypothetical protein